MRNNLQTPTLTIALFWADPPKKWLLQWSMQAPRARGMITHQFFIDCQEPMTALEATQIAANIKAQLEALLPFGELRY